MSAIAESESQVLSSTADKKLATIYTTKRHDVKFIVDVLNYVAANDGNVHAACKKFKVSRTSVLAWIDQYNALVSPREQLKRRLVSPYSDETKAKAVEMYRQGMSVVKIVKKLKLKGPTVYTWIREAAEKESGNKSSKKNKIHPAVSKVIEDIRNEQAGGETHSLASDFGISANAESRETGTPVELKFCPCCGTNIKAVLIALQACKELR